MNVLQAALHGARRPDSQALLHARVPGRRQVAHRELTVQQLFLQLVAQHDVQWVRELIGVDPDQPALHAVQVGVDVVQLPIRAAHSEMLRQQRLHVAHEGAAAADDHLHEQRLALLERHAPIPPDGLIPPVLRQPEVVHGMTRLVHRSQQTGPDVVDVQARRHADIPWDALREGVLALIETSTLERKADRLHDLDDQGALLRRRKLSDQSRRGIAILQSDGLADQ